MSADKTESEYATDRRDANAAPAPPAKDPLRLDIQGLRAVAVLMVVLYHSGGSWLPGGYVGVDVFFVISGFLITGVLMRAAETTGLSLTSFYARRARRILPAATLVLVVCACLTLSVLPQSRAHDAGWMIASAAVFMANWVLSGQAVDYLRESQAPSVAQHFWTLGVEEQFYLLWPLLVLVAVHLSRRASFNRSGVDHGRLRGLTRGTALLLTLASLGWSIQHTSVSPDSAYFQTPTRMWELGLGVCLALMAPALESISASTRLVLGWSGLLAILAAGVMYDSGTPFPGYHALLPTLGAVAVIAAGSATSRGVRVEKLLSTPLLTWVGDRSYSLYLWHWPLVVAATYQLDHSLRIGEGLIVTLGAFAATELTYRFVEQPVRRSATLRREPLKALQMGAALVAVAALAGALIMIVRPDAPPTDTANGSASKVRTASRGSSSELGAAYLAEHPSAGEVRENVGEYTPTAATAVNDVPDVYARKCHQDALSVKAVACSTGSTKAPFKVALVGDSHAAQWVPALEALAQKYNWRLDSYTKSDCPLVDVTITPDEVSSAPYTACARWNRNVQRELRRDVPDLVLVSTYGPIPLDNGKRALGKRGEELLAGGLQRAWHQVASIGARVVVLADTPRPGINVPECLERHSQNAISCAVARSIAVGRLSGAQTEAASGGSGTSMVDLNDLICPRSSCAPVIGRVLVYRDENHLTATYARTLSDALHHQLAVLGAVPAGKCTSLRGKCADNQNALGSR